MRWKRNTLHIDSRIYRFKRRILKCARINGCIVVVFERLIIFIECTGEIVKHPLGALRTVTFLHNGVLFAEDSSRTLKYMTHPYEPILEVHTFPKQFWLMASSRNWFCVLTGEGQDRSLELFRMRGGETTSIYQMRPEEKLQCVWLKGTRIALVYRTGITIIALQLDKGESLPKFRQETKYTPVSGRVTQAIPIASKHSTVFLVNGCEVVDEDGLVFSFDKHNQDSMNAVVAKTARQQIKSLGKGYVSRHIYRFFKYESKGQEALAYSLPWKDRMEVHRKKAQNPDITLDALFSQCIGRLDKPTLLATAKKLEFYIHIVTKASSLYTPLFAQLHDRLVTDSPRHALLFRILSTKDVPADLYSYELLPYSKKYLERSKNPGYSLIRENQQASEHERESMPCLKSMHTLEDTEFIQSIPERIQNTGAIEECKQLLSGQQVGDFPFNEYDTENRRKKAFIFSVVTSVGRGVFLLGRNAQINIFQVPSMKVFLKKNNHVVAISTLNEWDKLWPSFHFAVAAALSIPNRPFISTVHMDMMGSKSLMCLAGSVFGMGLKDALGIKPLSFSERTTIARSLLLSLSKSYDMVLVGATILGNAFVFKGTANRKFTGIVLFNLRSKEMNSAMLMWSALALGILYMGKNDLFAKQVLIAYMKRKGAIKPREGAKVQYYDKYHRIAAAFSLAYISTGAEDKEYLRLPDRLCEIIVNGLVYMGTRQEKVARLLEESSPSATPIRRFYSALMQVLVMEPSSYAQALQAADGPLTLEEDAYAVAGAIFGHGLLHIPKGGRANSEFVSAIIPLLYRLEKRANVPTVVMDYTLLSVSLALNSTGDLKVLSICKRLLLSLRNVTCLNPIIDFSPFAGEYREQYGMRFGRIQHIKMCLSLLAPGCGYLRVSSTPQAAAFLVSSFYPEYPITPEDQDAFQAIRHFYTLSLEQIQETKERVRNNGMVDSLVASLSAERPETIKTTLDVISTYFEKHQSDALAPNVLEYAIEELYANLLKETPQ
ncbi:hypothetical protein NEHOM01_0680 [Nematocida homosporus]|uniref:uncharacterized protein n=1 Tax=Nematocida homosporus TaxID=1912981 RepID=UPI0022203AD5|nr:uncharacterized protein NEHOM01_0680 [Nematocida homosporus]KAI5185222.1 hypothetical protein NEHOM01_0680 [Nematocida homosporus]